MATNSLDRTLPKLRNTRSSMFEVSVSTRLPFMSENSYNGISKHWGFLGASILKPANPLEKMYLYFDERRSSEPVENVGRTENLRKEDFRRKRSLLTHRPKKIKYLSQDSFSDNTKKKKGTSFDEIPKPLETSILSGKSRVRRRSCYCKKCGDLTKLQKKIKDLAINNDLNKYFRYKLELEREALEREYGKGRSNLDSPSKNSRLQRKTSLASKTIVRRDSKIIASSLTSILVKRPSVTTGPDFLDFDKNSQKSSEESLPVIHSPCDVVMENSHDLISPSKTMSRIDEKKDEEIVSPLIPKSRLRAGELICLKKTSSNGSERSHQQQPSQSNFSFKLLATNDRHNLSLLGGDRAMSKQLIKLIKEKERIHREFKSQTFADRKREENRAFSNSLDKKKDIKRAYDSGSVTSRARTTKTNSHHVTVLDIENLKKKLILESRDKILASCSGSVKLSPREELPSLKWHSDEKARAKLNEILNERLLPLSKELNKSSGKHLELIREKLPKNLKRKPQSFNIEIIKSIYNI